MQNPDGVIYTVRSESINTETKMSSLSLREPCKQMGNPPDKEELSLLQGLLSDLNWAAQDNSLDVAFKVVELSSNFKQVTVNDLTITNN